MPLWHKDNKETENKTIFLMMPFKCSIIAVIFYTLCPLMPFSTVEWVFFPSAHSLKPAFSFAARHLDIKSYSNCHAEIWTNWSKRQNFVWVINNSDINSLYFTQMQAPQLQAISHLNALLHGQGGKKIRRKRGAKRSRGREEGKKREINTRRNKKQTQTVRRGDGE